MNKTTETKTTVNPHRRSFVTLVAGLGTILATRSSAIAQHGQGADRPLKIVFHVGEGEQWPYALSNVRNLTEQYPSAVLRVIVDGSGVYELSGTSDVVAQLAPFAAKGVQVQACHNALRDKKIDPSAVPKFVSVIPAGVVGLAQSQYEGYAYIRP